MKALVIDSDLTIFTAAEQKPRLLAFIETSQAPAIDLSKVEDLDTAGLQLLLLAKNEADRIGKTLRFVGHSHCVNEVLALTRLAKSLEVGLDRNGEAAR